MTAPVADQTGDPAMTIDQNRLDGQMILDRWDELDNYYFATGFSGHGFGIGPGAGRLMAELVTGAPPVVDPTPFRYSRFTDGSRPQPMTGF